MPHDLLDWARAALSSWPVRDSGQAGLRAAYLAQLEAHPDALWREGPPVHLTVSAFILDRERRNLLLTLHRKGRFWVQCGGHIERDDSTLSAAALREATEESGLTGLRVLGPGDLHRHELTPAFLPCREHLDVAYLLEAPLSATPAVSAESLDVAWWPVDALPEPVVPDLAGRLKRLLALV